MLQGYVRASRPDASHIVPLSRPASAASTVTRSAAASWSAISATCVGEGVARRCRRVSVRGAVSSQSRAPYTTVAGRHTAAYNPTKPGTSTAETPCTAAAPTTDTTRPASTLNSVLLPQSDGPIIVTNSPDATLSELSRSGTSSRRRGDRQQLIRKAVPQAARSRGRTRCRFRR